MDSSKCAEIRRMLKKRLPRKRDNLLPSYDSGLILIWSAIVTEAAAPENAREYQKYSNDYYYDPDPVEA